MGSAGDSNVTRIKPKAVQIEVSLQAAKIKCEEKFGRAFLALLYFDYGLA